MNALSLANLGRALFFPRGSTLFIQNDVADRLYLLLDGMVKLCFLKRSSGEEKTACFIRPGMFFGQSALLLGKPYGITARALTDCNVSVFDRQSTVELIRANPDFAVALMSSMAQELWFFGYHLLGNAYPATARTAYALLNLSYQLDPGAETAVRLKLSHDELASFASLTRVSVSKSLAELEREGLLTKKRNCIVILSKEALKHWLGQVSFCL